MFDAVTVAVPPVCAVLQSAYGDVKVRLELPAGVPLARSSSSAPDADGMQISTVSGLCQCGCHCHKGMGRLTLPPALSELTATSMGRAVAVAGRCTPEAAVCEHVACKLASISKVSSADPG